jgi:hypothetical protein
MKEILDAGGPAFLIPAVLFVLVFYLTRGLFGLHGRRNQNRKDFLDLWDAARARDDLWLEVAVRHQFGTYLPAHVIRLALGQPDKAQSLLDLSELWPLYRFDADAKTVNWQSKRHSSLNKLRIGRAALLAGYFICALLALLGAVIAAKSGSTTLLGWVYGVVSILFGSLAVISLMREDTIKLAASVGHEWVDRINQSANSSQPKKSA